MINNKFINNQIDKEDIKQKQIKDKRIKDYKNNKISYKEYMKSLYEQYYGSY